ncbi:MAG: helix-turn-helix transcriptional regulator [Solirubrobacterales bacterium]|nr:helix-turn-helix transcriptional regulator [Solirubrobacterales bacterium]
MKRTYGDACGIARALDVVGERWALLVVRELLLGPKRFTDLRAGLPHLSPDVLAQRLRELEQAGVVRRVKLPPPAGSRVYELTEWGRELEPVVLGLGLWGSSRAPFPSDHGELGADSLVLALKTLFEPARANGLVGRTYELRLGDEAVFAVRVGERELHASRGSAADSAATITAEPGVLEQVLWHGRSPNAGGLEIDGDRPAGTRFLRLFPLPG